MVKKPTEKLVRYGSLDELPAAPALSPEAGRTDWAKLRAMPESEIERIADADDENPPRDDWNDDKAG